MEKIKIYNHLTKELEAFQTIEPNKIKLYVCGPTVYNFIHIGNARCFITFDMIYRYFLYLGYDVFYLQNITDIDDKIINQSIKENIDEQKLSQYYYEKYITDLAKLNVKTPTKLVKITDEINEIKKIILELLKNKYAYISDENIYFDTSKITEYGFLSRKNIEKNITKSREIKESSKLNPSDFILWKKTSIGKTWDLEGINGRPGWHTECLALIQKYLGKQIDIHGGGIDLIFPHHENEIAQSYALNKNLLANFWIYNGHISWKNEKMSKSIGNVINVCEFCEKWNPDLLRWIFFQNRHSHPMNLTIETIEQHNKKFKYICNTLSYVYENVNGDPNLEEYDCKLLENFNTYMKNNFNLPNIITLIISESKTINKQKKDQGINLILLKKASTIIKILSILGFNINNILGKNND